VSITNIHLLSSHLCFPCEINDTNAFSVLLYVAVSWQNLPRYVGADLCWHIS